MNKAARNRPPGQDLRPFKRSCPLQSCCEQRTASIAGLSPVVLFDPQTSVCLLGAILLASSGRHACDADDSSWTMQADKYDSNNPQQKDQQLSLVCLLDVHLASSHGQAQLLIVARVAQVVQLPAQFKHVT